jgi:hypothetical protein
MPNFDPGPNDITAPPNLNANKYPPAAVAPANSYPTPVYAKDGAAQDQTTQDNVGVDGLININTASWKVLSMLPMVYDPPSDPSYAANHPAYVTANENLAKAIVLWRDGGTVGGVTYPAHGPFMSIFDLNAVLDHVTTQNLQNAEGTLNLTAATSVNGLLTPPDANFPNASSPGVANNMGEDYQSDFAVLNRISNLITTRSDTFTVYIVLEGWQNAGTATAQLKTTRRFAFIADRSGVNADTNTRFIKTVVFPND